MLSHFLHIIAGPQYEALRDISFPFQTLSKALKTPPVMLWTVLVLNRTSGGGGDEQTRPDGSAGSSKRYYTRSEWMLAIFVTAAVFVFMLSGDVSSPVAARTSSSAATLAVVGADGQQEGQEWGDDAGVTIAFGAFFLAAYLTCDSFTSSWQDSLFRKYGPKAGVRRSKHDGGEAVGDSDGGGGDLEVGHESAASSATAVAFTELTPTLMMFYTTSMSCAYAVTMLLLSGTSIEAIRFVFAHSSGSLIPMMVTMATASAISQFAIFSAIHRFGAYGFTMVRHVHSSIST